MALLEKNVGRRNFLKGSAAAAAAAALTSLTACAPKTAEELGNTGSSAADFHQVDSDEAIIGEQGEWLPMICGENCSGWCCNYAYVVDGVVVRQKTDDTHEDTDATPQQRSCPKGRSLRQQLYNVDRLKYPMRRKNWQPGGGENAHGELRGKDEWERVSWDEALDAIASELNRIYDDHGPRAVFCNSWRWLPVAQLLHAAGGCIHNADVESYGTWMFKPYMYGIIADGVWGQPDMWKGNDRTDMVNADYITLSSCDPAWNQGVMAHYYFKQAQEAGVKFVYLGPDRNVAAASLNAQWIPVRPGTDTAFLLAVMYEMMRLDAEEGDIIDWDFLNTYCVGFDLDHMPADAKLNECISEYVQGKYDGIPKTPEWATEICGTPVELITEYARIQAKTNNVMNLHSYGASRYLGVENLPQAFITVSAMGGHMGKSGNASACLFGYDCADSGPMLYRSNGNVRSNPFIDNPIGEHCCIEGPALWNSLLNGKYISTNVASHGDNAAVLDITNTKAQEMTCDARAIIAVNNNYLQSRQNLNDGIKVMRGADLVVACDWKPTLTCLFADFALPAATDWEYNDDPSQPQVWPYAGVNGGIVGRRDVIRSQHPFVKAMYEVRSDEWVLKELAKKMGLPADEIFPYDRKTMYFDGYLSMEYVTEDGETYANAFSFTEEDAKNFGVDNPPQDGAIPFTEFIKKGLFQIPRKPGDNYGQIGYADFIADPEGCPLTSKSGKFELYCQLKADNYNVMEINDEPIKPYANYFVPRQGYQDTFSDWENKVKGEYPLQMYNIHYMRRAHTAYDNMEWLQEAFVNPVFMNVDDAAERNLDDGDTVLVRSQWGKTLRHVQTLESLMPGCAIIPHGPHSVLDETDPDDIVDRGGNEQILYGPIQSNYFPQLDGYNSLLVEIEKYDGESIVEDCEREPILLGNQE